MTVQSQLSNCCTKIARKPAKSVQVLKTPNHRSVQYPEWRIIFSLCHAENADRCCYTNSAHVTQGPIISTAALNGLKCKLSSEENKPHKKKEKHSLLTYNKTTYKDFLNFFLPHLCFQHYSFVCTDFE